jgi:hypothetical protein
MLRFVSLCLFAAACAAVPPPNNANRTAADSGETECKLASARAGGAWNTYAATLHDRRDFSAYEVVGELDQQTADWNTATRLTDADFSSPYVMGRSYSILENLDDAGFVLARKSAEEAWRICTKAESPSSVPSRMHPMIAAAWRHLYALASTEQHAKIDQLDLANTISTMEWSVLSQVPRDYAIHEVLPYYFEELGAAQVGAKLRRLPKLGTGLTSHNLDQDLRSIVAAGTEQWGQDRKAWAAFLNRSAADLTYGGDNSGLRDVFEIIEAGQKLQASSGMPTAHSFDLFLEALRRTAKATRTRR